MNAGIELARSGRYAEAKPHLEQAGTIDPSNDQAFANLGVVHMELSEWHAAEEAYARAIAANDQVAGYHEKLGTARMQIALSDEAPGRVNTTAWEGARDAFLAAIERDPNLFKAYFKLAQVYERLDDPQSALEQYTEAIRHGPRFVEAYIALGQLYADHDFPTLAIQVLRSGQEVAIPGTSELARLHHMLGTVHQEEQNYEAAIDAFREALEIIPAMPDALASIGWCYDLSGNNEEAERYLTMFVNAPGPDTPEYYVSAARSRLEALRR